MKIGPSEHALDITFDTGSTWMWIPIDNCTNCPSQWFLYPPTESEVTDETASVQYVQGFISGSVLNTNISIAGLTIPDMDMIGVDQGNDNNGLQSNGLVGMTPEPISGEGDLLID